MIWLIFSGLLLLLYSLLILFYWYGYNRIPYFNEQYKPENPFTILIAARNEEDNIGKCLNAIIAQNYPKELFEVVVVNDSSTDKTENIILQFAAIHKNILLLNAKDYLVTGKKNAITVGVKQAKNNYCILTDADCSMKNTWLHQINSFIKKNNPQFIYAPVSFNASKVFEKIQSLEFAGLVGIGASAIFLKNPNMCSGANIVFKKDVFFEVDGYKDNLHISSGDDEFLLHKIFKRYPNGVFFLKSYDAIVNTGASASFKELSNQRRRWVSKSTKYENRYITLILAGAYVFNFSIMFNFIYGILANSLFLYAAITQLLVKATIESAFLYYVLKLFNQKKLLWYMPLAQPLHIVYVLVIGIWANINTYNWKGREVK